MASIPDIEKPAKTNASSSRFDSSPSRKLWILFSQLCTFFIPNLVLSYLLGMSRDEYRLKSSSQRIQAWREKVALCVIIFLLSLVLFFYLWFFGTFLCPDCKVMSFFDFQNLNVDTEPCVLIYGRVFDLKKLFSLSISRKGSNLLSFYAGKDASALFAQDIFNQAMDGIGRIPSMPSVSASAAIKKGKPLEAFSRDSSITFGINSIADIELNLSSNLLDANSPETMGLLEALSNCWVADLGWDTQDLASRGSSKDSPIISVEGVLFNVSSLLQVKDESVSPVQIALTSLPWSGFDHTAQLVKALSSNDANPANILAIVASMAPIVGIVDPRSPLKCAIGRQVLMGSAALVLLITGVKFLAALQLGRKKLPEVLGRHTILHMTCFTEGEASLRKSIGSLVSSDYDDRFKLLWIVCDGLATGAGNDRPTAVILLDILGISRPASVDETNAWMMHEGHPIVSYDSLGDQNYVKFWYGYYHQSLKGSFSHAIPFVLIVKLGSPGEISKCPGNRGKRDSQLILLRWLSKLLHLANQSQGTEEDCTAIEIPIPQPQFSPLEEALTGALHGGLGMDPLTFEYLLMVDADTQCAPDALTRLISVMIGDRRVVGVCGETTLANPRASWVTSIQVYEYYITHHLSKAFESLFGVVTCLPGCFTLYRLRTPVTSYVHGGDSSAMKPLLLSPALLAEYGTQENSDSTLHRRNLLTLGEDRFLTTLLLKYFPNYKTSFSGDALCKTIAPESWRVLLSQRRRWINSTIHNLWELLSIPRLCGIGCISMKLVVLLDLNSTLVMPATMVYLLWCATQLIISNIFALNEDDVFSTYTSANSALLLAAATFAMQASVCVLKRRWYIMGWMFLYILTLPVFCFILPLYAFCNFDDFTWGRTRKQQCPSSIKENHTIMALNPWGSRPHHPQLFGRYSYNGQLDTCSTGHGDPIDPVVIGMRCNTIAALDYSPHSVVPRAKVNEIEAAVKKLLVSHDADHLSLGEIRSRIEHEISMDLSSLKEWFSTLVESILMEMLMNADNDTKGS